MKPNDKAIEAAIRYLEAPRSAREQMEQILTAAFAAQFPPSEDYAELVKELRKWKDWAVKFNALSSPGIMRLAQAADALEALLAERDALKAELARAQKLEKMQAERIGGYINTVQALEAERAALEGVTEPLATHKEPDEHLNLKNAECLPSTVAVIKSEPPR